MPHVTIEGLDIHYRHHRPAAAAAVTRVLYVHGTGCTADVFERHLAVLAERHEVAAIDLPGHGRSGGNGFRGVADYAAYCAGLVRALGWRDCVVAGHSLGGGIALAMALYDPELVRALMLVDTGARLRVAPEIIRAARAAAARGARGAGNPRQGFAGATPDTIVESIRAVTAGCDPHVVAKDWIADDTCDFMSRLAAITVPALALCGREDPLTPLRYHEYFRDHLPDCELVVVERAGHWPFVEQPAAYDRAVTAFLERVA